VVYLALVYGVARMKRHWTRTDMRLAAWRQTLFVDDPRTWPVWETIAWLLPVVLFVLIPVAVYLLWRSG